MIIIIILAIIINYIMEIRIEVVQFCSIRLERAALQKDRGERG